MCSFNEFVTNADQFGAISQVSFFNSDGKFKTIYGGILSLLVYSLGSSYFLYLMVMWQTSQIAPTIVIQQQFDNTNSKIKLTRPFYVFSLEADEGNNETYALQKKGDIFQYDIGSYGMNGVYLTKNPAGFGCSQPAKETYDYFDPICMNLEDQYQTHLFQNYKNRTQDTYVNISIDYCDPSINKKCLSFDDQQKIFSKFPQWRLTLITQELNLSDGAIHDIPQDYYFDAQPYQNITTLSLSLRITKGTYIIDTGILFPNLNVIEIVRSIELINQATQQVDPQNNVPLIAFISYNLSRNEEIITITHPKIGQILADLGSILQVLMLVGLIMNQFNHTQMQIKIEEILIGIYFPEIKLFEFRYNWRGIIQSISQNGQLLRDFDFDQMKQFRMSTGKLIRSKLNYLNILHEISRIQIQLQSQITRQLSIKYQSLGYNLRLPFNCEKQKITVEKKGVLDFRDFQLLCLHKLESHENNIPNNLLINCDSNKASVDQYVLIESPVSNYSPEKRNSVVLGTNIQSQQQMMDFQISKNKMNKILPPEQPDLFITDKIITQRIKETDDQESHLLDHVIPDERNSSNQEIISSNLQVSYPPLYKIQNPSNLNQTL